MPGLFASLQNAVGALDVYSKVLSVCQNNVANASTPGYVKQIERLTAQPFDPGTGLLGGVRAADVESARDAYAERAVWREMTSLGYAQHQVESLTPLQSVLDISGESGLSAALNRLYQSFSAWAQSPVDTVARQTVLERAQDVATEFRQAAMGLARASSDLNTQLRQTVDRINLLAGKLAEYNQGRKAGGGRDAGSDAQFYATLEELSQYVDVSMTEQEDGSVTLMLGGAVPLLVSQQVFPLAYHMEQPAVPPPTYPEGPPAAVLTSDAADVTAKLSAGGLGALLDLRNRVLPSLTGDAYQAGDLNVLARQFADRVNAILTSGYVSNGELPDAGVPLFTFGEMDDTRVAASLAVDPELTADRLPAIDAGPPEVSNGIPLRLSQLASPLAAEDAIGGASFVQYYGQLAARVGAELSDATDRRQVREATVAQAQNLRQQMSGVSLDEEAMILLQFQRAYQANSRLVTALNQMADDLMNMLTR